MTKKTKSFKILLGVAEGYFHNNDSDKNIENISEIWKQIALNQMENTGLYISSVISSSKTVYNTEWGCPYGGENTFTITGVANLEFIKDINKWIETVKCCAKEIKKELKQSTLTIEFYDSEILYLKD